MTEWEDAQHAAQNVLIQARPQPTQTCATCVHLQPFELAPELNTCPIVNIRIHRESAAIFGCNQWAPHAIPVSGVEGAEEPS